MKNGLNKISRGWLPVVAILALSGCSDIGLGGLFGDDTPAPQTASEQNLRDRADTEQASAEDSDTPSLTSVPNRPAAGSTANRNRVVEGLISDRDNARYTDEAIRLQGSTRPATASQAAAAPAPAEAEVAVTSPPAPPPPAPIARTEPSSANAQTAQTQIRQELPGSSSGPQIRQALPGDTVTTAARPTLAPATGTGQIRQALPGETSTAQIRQPRPAPGGPQIRQELPQVASTSPAPAPSSSESVVVDMSALSGGGYAPASAQISPEAQVATIQFGRSSSRLDARDQQLINAVATAQRQNGGNVLVVGHASSRTQQLPKDRHDVANFQVSFARANAVAQALIRAGVAADRVTVEAVSDGQPIYSEAMPTGEAGNRRAEIYFLR